MTSYHVILLLWLSAAFFLLTVSSEVIDEPVAVPAAAISNDTTTALPAVTTAATSVIVNVDVINTTSIRVEWDSAADKDNVQCPVRRYVVRLKDGSAIRAKSWKYDKSTTSAVINSLKPSTEYHLRLVVDTNCTDGKGKAGRWVFFNTPPATTVERVAKSISSSGHKMKLPSSTTPGGGVGASQQQLVPGQPLSVGTRVLTADSVLVTWQAPTDGGPINGYMIGYGEGVPDVNWQYLEPYRRNVTIKNLKPSTQYVISVRAFNDIDKGPVVYDLVYTSTANLDRLTSAERRLAPIKLQTRMLSPNSVWIQWVDPSLGRTQKLTDSRYYNVHYQATPNGKTLSVIVKELHSVLTDLEPATRYEFKVRTVKDGQTSPFSETVINWTSNITGSHGSRGPSRQTRPSDVATTARPAADDDEDYDDDDDASDDEMDDDSWLNIDQRLVRDSHKAYRHDGEGGKTKREPVTLPYSRQEIKRLKQNVTSAALRNPQQLQQQQPPEVQFSTLVLHRISAYITWPALPVTEQCSGTRSQVIGYKLRYQPAHDVSEFIAHNLASNYVLLENLMSGVRYRYQVKYLLPNGVEMPWSVERMFDTTPGPVPIH